MLFTIAPSVPNGDDVWILEIEMSERMEANGQETIKFCFQFSIKQKTIIKSAIDK